MNKFRKVLLKIACFIFAVSSVALVSSVAKFAFAQETEQPAAFVVEEKSAVRLADDGYYGLRFFATINNAWYNENVGKGVKSTVGILIYPKQDAPINVESKTVEAVIDEVKAVSFAYPIKHVNDTYTYSGAVVYNAANLIANGIPADKIGDALNMYYAMEMEAMAYVQVGENVFWAENTYSNSMRKTAALSVIADPTNQDIYERYYNVLGEVSALVAKGENGKFFDLDVEDGKYEFYTETKKTIPVEVVDGALTITDSAVLAEMESGDYTGFLFADGNDRYLRNNNFYKVDFVVADVVITSAQELQDAFEPTAKNTKYYALANDIDLEGFVYVGPTGEFTGTFNGRGYAIKNFFARRAGYATGWTASNTLFGLLVQGGTIKNLSVIDFWDSDHWTPSFVTGRMCGTVENIYLRPRPGLNTFNAFGAYSDSASAVWKNIILDYQPIEKEYQFNGSSQDEYYKHTYRAGKDSIQAQGTQGLSADILGQVEGVYVISPYHTATYTFGNYYSNPDKDPNYIIYFAEGDEEMPYLDTIKNADGTYTHTRIPFPADMVDVLNNYNASLAEGQEPYEFDENNLTVDDFIKFTEVDAYTTTKAYRLKGTKRFNTYADMAAANENLKSFEDSKYWSVSNGIPYWHGEVSRDVVVTVAGLDTNVAPAEVGRDQSAEIAITYQGKPATINYTVVADEYKDCLAANGNVIYGLANVENAIVTVNYTFGGKTYNKQIAVNVVNPIQELDKFIVYDADTKSFDYDFGGNINSGYLVTDTGVVDAVVDETGFAVKFNPETNVSNIVTMFVDLDDITYKLTNVQYWDYIIDDGAEYSRVMGYDANDGVVRFYVTLSGDIDMFITSDVSVNLNSIENNIVMLAGGGVVKKGAYHSLNNYGKDNSDLVNEWWGENAATNQCGFAGVFDGRGYSVSNIVVAMNTEKGATTVVSNYGIFSQFTVSDTVIPEVRNVAFIDVVTNTGAILAQYIARTPGTTANMIIDNVYVKQLASCAFGSTLNDSNLVTVGTVNQYGPNALFKHAWNVKISNFVFEHASSKDYNNNANGVHGSLFGEVGDSSVAAEKYDASDLDARLENVVYLTNGMLHTGALAKYRDADSVAAAIKATGKLEFTRTYQQGFFVYGANETTGQQPHFQGFADGADISTLTGSNLIWAVDNLSNVAPGSYVGTSVYKMKNLVRYKDRNAMSTSGHDVSYFANSKYWTVVNGAPVWAGARKSASSATINGAKVSAESAFELNVNETANVAVSAPEGYDVVINSVVVENANVATANGATITALTAGETSYVVNATVDGIAVSFTGALKVNRNIISVDNAVNYFSYNNVFAFAIDGDVQSAVADGVELNVDNGIVLDTKPETLVITTDKEVLTLTNIVFNDSLPSNINSAILYDKFDLSLDYDFGSDIFAAYMIKDGERVDLIDNGELDIPAVPTTASSNVIEITVVTLDGIYVLSNVEYWDEIITEVHDFSNNLSYTSSDEAVIGWYALGNDIDFKLAESGAYTITDLRHEFDLHFNTASYNAIYYLINRYSSNSKTDAFLPNANNGFGGIFDGKGYTLYNHVNIFNATNGYLYGTEGGLFGKLYSTETITPVVKNFAMINGIATSGGVVIADTVSNVGVQRIENIYIDDARTAYVAYGYDKATNVSTQNIALSAYSVSGIVRDVGHTYMKNVIYKHNESGPFNYNAYAGGNEMGTLFSTFNKVDTAQTIDSYDNTYLDNVVVISSGLLTISDLNYNIGTKPFTKRGPTSYATYGGNPYPTSLKSESTAYKTPQSKNDDGTFVTDWDDYDSLTPGDGSSMENGVYRFKNAYHYANRNRFMYAYKDNFGTMIMDKFAECPYFAFNRRLYNIEIFWQGNAEGQSSSNLPAQVKLGDVDLDVRYESELFNGETYELSTYNRKQTGINSFVDTAGYNVTLSSSNTNVATVSGTTLTTVGVGQTKLSISFRFDGSSTHTMDFIVNVTNRPIEETEPVYYYSATNYFAYDFVDEIVSAKYVLGGVETEIDLTYGLILPEQAFSADKVILSTGEQEYIFNEVVNATGFEEVAETVVYEAYENGLDYSFEGREIVSIAITYRDGTSTTIDVENNNIVIPQVAQGADKNGNVLEVLVLLKDGMVKLSEVIYWDRLIDSSREYAEIFSYDTSMPRLVGWYALTNNIDFLLGTDINEKPEGDNVEYVDWMGSKLATNGWYQTVKQDYGNTKDGLSSWSNSATDRGFGAVLDGQGYAMDNYATIMFNGKTSKSSSTFGGMFSQTNSLPGVYTGVRNLALNHFAGNVIFAYYEVGDGLFEVDNVFIDWVGTMYANHARGTNGEFYVQNLGAYGFSGIVQEQKNLALNNVVVQTPNWTRNEGSSNSPTPGIIAKTFKDIAKYDANSSNVVVISKHVLYYGYAAADKTNIDKACYKAVVDAETQVETLTFNPDLWIRGVNKGLVVYGANETVATVVAYQGYLPETTAELIKAQTAVGQYQIWAEDDVASLTAGDTSKLNEGMMKLASTVRFDSYADFSTTVLASEDNVARTMLSSFTAPCWTVDLSTGSIAWNRLA